jgi:transposase
MGAVDQVTERFKVSTTRKALENAFANRPKAEIVIEACRDARWVRDVLVKLGHEVIVADTSRIRAIGVGHGRRKNDRNDAEALARALWRGVVPAAHVLSARAARLRDVLLTRQQLVAQRTGLVTMVRGQLQAEGLDAPSCKASAFADRVTAMAIDFVRTTHVQCTISVLRTLNEQIRALESELKQLAEAEESYDRLISTPGVKLIVALAFIGALDDPGRFSNAHSVQAYLGLVPSEASTGGKQRLGRITKVGNSMARWALVQGAQTLLRMNDEKDPLIIWAKNIAGRRGKRIAIIALARRLAGILWAMWSDGTFYDPQHVARASATGLSRRARRATREANEMQRATIAAPMTVSA